MNPTSDRIGAFDAKLAHFEAEVLKGAGGTRIDPDNLRSIQDMYFWGCTLVDKCLAEHHIQIDYDFERTEVLWKLAKVSPSFSNIYAAFSLFELGYQLRLTSASQRNTGADEISLPDLLISLYNAVAQVCPP